MADDIGTGFAGDEMLLTDPDWIEDIESVPLITRRIYSYGYTSGTVYSLNTDTPIGLTVNYPINNHQELYELIDFFNSRKAKTHNFWFLHPSKFFTLQSTYVSGAGYIECVRNFSHLWTQGLSSQYDWGIYIKMDNGDLITRKVTGIVDGAVVSASNVYLDETIPRNISLTNHYIIGRILFGRFDNDDLSIKMKSISQGLANVTLQENYREFSTWSASSFSQSSESSEST